MRNLCGSRATSRAIASRPPRGTVAARSVSTARTGMLSVVFRTSWRETCQKSAWTRTHAACSAERSAQFALLARERLIRYSFKNEHHDCGDSNTARSLGACRRAGEGLRRGAPRARGSGLRDRMRHVPVHGAGVGRAARGRRTRADRCVPGLRAPARAPLRRAGGDLALGYHERGRACAAARPRRAHGGHHHRCRLARRRARRQHDRPRLRGRAVGRADPVRDDGARAAARERASRGNRTRGRGRQARARAQAPDRSRRRRAVDVPRPWLDGRAGARGGAEAARGRAGVDGGLSRVRISARSRRDRGAGARRVVVRSARRRHRGRRPRSRSGRGRLRPRSAGVSGRRAAQRRRARRGAWARPRPAPQPVALGRALRRPARDPRGRERVSRAGASAPGSILTVTLNLALDLTYAVDAVEWHAANRVARVHERAGGKGVNVARVLSALGHEPVVLGFAGGATGAAARADLAAAGLRHTLVEIHAATRRTVAVVDAAGGDATGFWEPGPRVRAEEWTRLAGAFAELLDGCAAVVLAGSLPAGVPVDAYAALGSQAARRRIPVVLDAAGAARRHGLAARPDVVKPNAQELARAGDAGALRAAGAAAVVASHGADGLVAITGEGGWRARPPERVQGNPTGAGDAAVAALTAGIVAGSSWPERLRDAVALSAAAVHAPVAGAFDAAAYRGYLPRVEIESLGP